MPLQRQKASRRPQLRGHSSLFRDQPRAWSRRRQRPGLTAPPHSALPNGAACIPLHRALCSRFAFARRTLIKSLPGQELRTGSDLRAFNKENPPETRKGWPSMENFRARPSRAFSLLGSPSSQGLCGFSATQFSPTPYPRFCDLRKQF